MKSEQINELATALAKAQGEIENVAKNATNPHFKSDYSTLDAVLDVCRGPLSKNGLSIIQNVETIDGQRYLRTILAHSSGQFYSSTCPLILDKNNMQGLGSAISYARRYEVMSYTGMASREDDDGNNASQSPGEQKPGKDATSPPSKAATISDKQIARLMALANKAKLPEIGLKEIVKRHGFSSRKDITMGAKYDAICQEVEAWKA